MLKQLSLLTFLSLSTGAYALAAPSGAECADVLIITARGSTEFAPDPPTVAPDSAQVVNANSTRPKRTGEGELGEVAAFVQNSTNGITINRQAVIYPALDDTAADYLSSFQNGTKSLVKIVEEATTQCKDQKLVLMGYSQGAHCLGDALSGPGGSIWGPVEAPLLDPKTYADKILAVVFWGDPRHNQTGQVEFVVGFPNATEDGYFPRTETQDDILKQYYGNKFVSYCTDKDRYCSSGVLGADQITANNKSEDIHLYSYLNTSVMPAVAFIQAHLKSVKSSSNGTSTAGTPTGTAAASAGASASGKNGASQVALSVGGLLTVAAIISAQLFM